MISSIRLDGSTAYMALERTTDTESFRAFVSEVLLPTLRPEEIVVMDNLSPHKSDPILALITAIGQALAKVTPKNALGWFTS